MSEKNDLEHFRGCLVLFKSEQLSVGTRRRRILLHSIGSGNPTAAIGIRITSVQDSAAWRAPVKVKRPR